MRYLFPSWSWRLQCNSSLTLSISWWTHVIRWLLWWADLEKYFCQIITFGREAAIFYSFLSFFFFFLCMSVCKSWIIDYILTFYACFFSWNCDCVYCSEISVYYRHVLLRFITNFQKIKEGERLGNMGIVSCVIEATLLNFLLFYFYLCF